MAMERVLRALGPCLAAGLLAGLSCAAGAAPSVWMVPPSHEKGRSLRELFEKPAAWQAARAKVQVLGYADHQLNRQFTDAELGRWLPMLGRWGLKLGLEVGAVKEWAPTGAQAFAAQQPMWERFRRLGGRIHAIALDEPLCCTRQVLKKPDAYAVTETADFIARVRKAYPDVLIGDIEAYPYIPLEEMKAWIDALEAELARRGVRGMDFFRLDVDWVSFTLAGRGSWQEVRKIEEHCRARKLPFSLIYWASDQPHLERAGLATEATWHESITRQALDYALVGGKPDEMVIESWIPAPPRATPDSDPTTFAGSVLDFTQRFVKAAK